MAKRFSDEYRQLLNSWQWKFTRALVFNRDGYTCKKCKAHLPKPTKTRWLECDHLRYEPHGSTFEELLSQPLSDYQTLCNICHRKKTRQSTGKRKAHR
jgi:predicted CXXCH cytochrome family protein